MNPLAKSPLPRPEPNWVEVTYESKSSIYDEDCLFFDVHLEPRNKLPLALQLFEQFQVVLKREQERVHRVKYETAIQVVLLNFIALRQAGYRLLAVSRDNNAYKRRYNIPRVSCETICAVLDWMEREKYLESYNWSFNHDTGEGYRTRYAALPKLLELLPNDICLYRSSDREVIQLKRGGKQKYLIDYQDTPETERLRQSVRALNSLLEKTTFELDGRVLPVQQFHRVFNDGSFELGGRFFGASVQDLSQEDRPRVKINGDCTVELDFSAFHIRILYKDKYTGGDPYRIDGFSRENVKFAMFILLNAKSKQGAIKACINESREPSNKRDFTLSDPVEIKNLFRAIEEVHSPIAKEFYRCPAKWLQRTDSRIAEQVLDRFVKQSIPIICIHDSFLVAAQHEALLRSTMLEAYEIVTGFGGAVIRPEPVKRDVKAA